MLDEHGITEARRRLRDAARNEQTSIALNDLLHLANQEIKCLREENERLRKDAERLDWITEEYAHLQPFGIPTGEGDYET